MLQLCRLILACLLIDLAPLPSLPLKALTTRSREKDAAKPVEDRDAEKLLTPLPKEAANTEEVLAAENITKCEHLSTPNANCVHQT